MISILFVSVLLTTKVSAADSLWVKPEWKRYTYAETTKIHQYVARNMPVWKFKETTSSGAVLENQTKTLYCLRGGPGFSETTDMGGVTSGLEHREYTVKFDMNKPETITGAYQDAIPTPDSDRYKQLMWILNEMYIPADENATAEEKEMAEGYKMSLFYEALFYWYPEYDLPFDPTVIEHPDGSKEIVPNLTDHDFEVVQQLAIWCLGKQIAGDKYSIFFDENMQIAINPNETVPITTIQQATGDLGEQREAEATALYEYLLAASYDYLPYFKYNTGDTRDPIKLKDTNVTVDTTTINGYYVVGPYQFEEVRSAMYALESYTVTTNKGVNNQVTYVEKSGNTYVDNGKTPDYYTDSYEEFYIKIPADSDITKIDFAFTGSFINTDIYYWSVKDGDTRYNELAKEQPIVEVERTYEDFGDNVTVNLTPEGELDLALRKSITKLNGQAPSVIRLPDEKVDNLYPNGTDETAKYNHPKNDLTTKTGQLVEYTITVYNEGEKDAYASEIKDYLPAGIEFVELVSDTSKYSASASKNADGSSTVTITNKGKTVLKAFERTMTEPDSESFVIRCKVTADENDGVSKRLVNIAEITKYFDVELNQEVSEDRDSKPGNFPDGYKNNPSYNGNGKDGDYVPGQEDDDDFEPLVIKGLEFDLALRKFIVKVGNYDYVEADGTYTREPEWNVDNLYPNGTDETAVYNHSKKPVPARVGDEVIYMIRVYNEGQVDGYANEIKDYLPDCLEFLPTDEFNIARGWVIYTDPETGKPDPRIVVTDHLSEDKDAEENLIKAFDGERLDYKEVAIKCKIVKVDPMPSKITNIAEITEYSHDDRDSDPDNVTVPDDNSLPTYKDDESNKDYVPGQEDDDDFDKLIIQDFDLALRKFITKIGERDITTRIPKFSIENGKYVYRHDKTPLEVDTGDVVIYTIRIFNEGNIAGYASEISDDIPVGLEFLPEHDTNKLFRWKMLDKDGKETTDSGKAVRIQTDYLSKDNENVKGQYLLDPFDPTTMDEPFSRDVQVAFKVIAANSTEGIITNYAQISEDTDEDGEPIDDKDSTPDEWIDDEDDQDVEHIKLTRFDLALRKFITGVNEKAVTDRVPKFSIKDGKYVYNHTKEPIVVENGNEITYTIRVYNEGTKAGYAAEIADDIPDGLEFLPEHEVNKSYRWKMVDQDGNETKEPTLAVRIITDYLSKENETEPNGNLLEAFNPETMTEPDHLEVKVVFKVTEPNTSDRIVINHAQITEDTDKDGNPVIDEDSTPDKWIDNDDDQDIEKIRVKYFDLALKKWVTQAIIIENGKETIIESGHTGDENPEPPVKVEIVAKKLNKVVVKFRYKIKITNEGEIAGYATEISDYIPEGLKFVAADNPEWEEVDGKVVTDQLKDTLLQPGESATVEIVLTWINGANNLGLKVNIAEISKDKNDSNTPDIDSRPNNRVEGEDDIDDAPVVLSIKTGENGNNIEYIGTALGVVIILTTGIILIKKYVLI